MGIKLHPSGYYVAFHCPGCECGHRISVKGPHSVWGWNGSVTAPTFTPSILITGGHFARGFVKGSACWCTYNAEHLDAPAPFKCSVCHSFVTDGKIRFLPDSTHALSGKTVDLPDWDDQ